MSLEITSVPPNSPILSPSPPPYDGPPDIPIATISQPVDQSAIRLALRHLANDPHLSSMSFDVAGLGHTTFDVQRLPFPMVQAMVLVGLAMNTQMDNHDR